MVWIDYAILAIIGISTFISLIRGFVKEALSLVAWIGAFFVASNFYANLANLFTNITDEFLRNAAAATILFIATLVLAALVNYIISQLVNKTGLSGTDRLLGLVFGALRGVLIVSALLFFMDAFTSVSTKPWWQESELVHEFKFVIEWFFEYLKQSSSLLT
jgi:membrane protein required for colicin V production